MKFNEHPRKHLGIVKAKPLYATFESSQSQNFEWRQLLVYIVCFLYCRYMKYAMKQFIINGGVTPGLIDELCTLNIFEMFLHEKISDFNVRVLWAFSKCHE